MKKTTLLKAILMVSQIAMCSKTHALPGSDVALQDDVRSSLQIEVASGLSGVCAELSQLSQACESPKSFAKVKLDNLMNACHVLSSTAWSLDGNGVIAAKKQVLKYFIEGSAPHTKVSLANNFNDLELFIVSEYTHLKSSQLYRDACIGQPNTTHMLLGMGAVFVVSLLSVSFVFYRYMNQVYGSLKERLDESLNQSELLNKRLNELSDGSSGDGSHHSSHSHERFSVGQQDSMAMMYPVSRPLSAELLRGQTLELVPNRAQLLRRRTNSQSSLSQVFPQQPQPRTSTPNVLNLNAGNLDFLSEDERDEDSALADASVRSGNVKARKKPQPKEKPTASKKEKPAMPTQKKASKVKRAVKDSKASSSIFSDGEE
jgi:hypothetical protein